MAFFSRCLLAAAVIVSLCCTIACDSCQKGGERLEAGDAECVPSVYPTEDGSGSALAEADSCDRFRAVNRDVPDNLRGPQLPTAERLYTGSCTESTLEHGSSSGPTLRIVNAYDDDGYLVRREYFGHMLGGAVAEFTNDDEGFPLVEEADVAGPGGGAQRILYVYEEGQLVSMDMERGGGITSQDLHFYDDRGNLIRTEKVTVPEGRVLIRHRYTYDEHDRCILEEREGNGDGRVTSRVRFTYDADGRLIYSESETRADGNVRAETIYEYDEFGNLLREGDNSGPGSSILRTVIHTYECW